MKTHDASIQHAEAAPRYAPLNDWEDKPLGSNETKSSPDALSAAFNAADIAKTAEAAVRDRGVTHGDKLSNHQCIAFVWSGYLSARRFPRDEWEQLSALDVANMMELLKIARRLTGSHNIDDYIDGAGYAAVAGEIAERLK